jgi:YkoY family integral membrane protein
MWHDLLTVFFLVFLEGALSLDNAVVLAVLVQPLPENLRQKALTYGIIGAFVFRILALAFLTFLIQIWWVKPIAAFYLLYLAFKHFTETEDQGLKDKPTHSMNFWRVIIAVELTDVAFSIDSIFAGVGMTSKIAIVAAGGMIGIVMMRFVALEVTHLIEKFPKLTDTAYRLVALIGIKLVLDSFDLKGLDFDDVDGTAFWSFWALMTVTILHGLNNLRQRNRVAR